MKKQNNLKQKNKLVEVRCSCNRLLGMLPPNSPYEIECVRCGKLNKKSN